MEGERAMVSLNVYKQAEEENAIGGIEGNDNLDVVSMELESTAPPEAEHYYSNKGATVFVMTKC